MACIVGFVRASNAFHDRSPIGIIVVAICKLLQTGQLKGFKEGNRYKVPVESVEQYVEMKMRT